MKCEQLSSCSHFMKQIKLTFQRLQWILWLSVELILDIAGWVKCDAWEMIKLAVCVSWMQLAAMTATCDKYITNVVMVWLIMRHVRLTWFTEASWWAFDQNCLFAPLFSNMSVTLKKSSFCLSHGVQVVMHQFRLCCLSCRCHVSVVRNVTFTLSRWRKSCWRNVYCRCGKSQLASFNSPRLHSPCFAVCSVDVYSLSLVQALASCFSDCTLSTRLFFFSHFCV